MQYMVLGTDGKEYGPVDDEGLKQWVAQQRVRPQTLLKVFESGQTLNAGSIPGLFAPAAPQPGYIAPTTGYSAVKANSGDAGPMWGVAFEAALGVAVFFFLKGLGVILGGFALYRAIRIAMEGNRFGIAALVVAVVALAVIGVGWMMRLSGSGL